MDPFVVKFDDIQTMAYSARMCGGYNVFDPFVSPSFIRLWWRLHTSEKFSSGKNKQTKMWQILINYVYPIITDIRKWFLCDWLLLMHDIAFRYVQHCQAMLEPGECKAVLSFFHFPIISFFVYGTFKNNPENKTFNLFNTPFF